MKKIWLASVVAIVMMVVGLGGGADAHSSVHKCSFWTSGAPSPYGPVSEVTLHNAGTGALGYAYAAGYTGICGSPSMHWPTEQMTVYVEVQQKLDNGSWQTCAEMETYHRSVTGESHQRKYAYINDEHPKWKCADWRDKRARGMTMTVWWNAYRQKWECPMVWTPWTSTQYAAHW